ncbi:MAG: antitoxin Xre/MbcA/ParS toxin-binding domain-containing protein [Cyanobacteria bacterium P01_A01_bin.83]
MTLKTLKTIDAPNALPQIYTGKDLSLKKLAGFMGITHQEMADIIDKDLRTVQRDTASTKVAQKLNPVIYILKMLWELTGEDLVAVQRWLREPLVEWRGLTPLSCLLEHKFDAVVQLVERIHFGDSAGY